MTGTDERQSILHQGEGDAKWSVWVRRFPFLEETFARRESWWTERTTPNESNGPNRKSLAGLAWGNCVAMMHPLHQRSHPDGSWFAKILKLHLSSWGIVGAGQ